MWDRGRGELVECVQIEGRVTVRTQGLEDLVFQKGSMAWGWEESVSRVGGQKCRDRSCKGCRDFPVAQWVRTCLESQGTRAWSLVRRTLLGTWVYIPQLRSL